jgi:hypothetical protein
MSPIDTTLTQARVVAKQVLDGTLSPCEACIEIAALCEANNWPVELVPFSSLAHEQDGHEDFGFTRDNLVPLIVEECRILLGGLL